MTKWDSWFNICFIELKLFWVISDCSLIYVLLWLFVDKEKWNNSEKEASSFLGFEPCFELGYSCDFIIVCCMHVLASLWYVYVYECYNIDHTCCKCDRGVINTMNNDLIVWFWDYTFDYDCGLFNGSGVAFWHSNLDWFSRSEITMGSDATFQHKHWISYYISTC